MTLDVSSAKNLPSIPTSSSVLISGTTCLVTVLVLFEFKQNTGLLSPHAKSSQLNGPWKVTKETNGVMHKLTLLVVTTSRYAVSYVFIFLFFIMYRICIHRVAKQKHSFTKSILFFELKNLSLSILQLLDNGIISHFVLF